jgi:hypothetical protein
VGGWVKGREGEKDNGRKVQDTTVTIFGCVFVIDFPKLQSRVKFHFIIDRVP